MTFDPYTELDVPRDATAAQVKSAYRKRAKKAHPDAGGTAEKFNRISRALLILSDPGRREKYDKTGDVDEATPEPDNTVAVAISIIVGFVAQVVAQYAMQGGGDPCGIDLVAKMREHFKKQRVEFENQKVPINKAVKKLEQIEKRFKARKKSNPLLIAALASQRNGMREPLRGLDTKIQQIDDALALLDGYDFEVDKANSPHSSMPIHQGFAFFGTGFGSG